MAHDVQLAEHWSLSKGQRFNNGHVLQTSWFIHIRYQLQWHLLQHVCMLHCRIASS